ncbi:MAG: DUF1405 domain-containing protein [Dethiobacter sp.]|jgi:uncharacterized membrane protein YpjA|nr:DUF1405 domain-containing protein [Dethiobacter sp.]
MRKLLSSLINSSWFFNSLLFINFFGTIYGFYWYESQFAVTPLYFWPFVANSPLSVLYIFIVLILFKQRKRSAFWEGLAYFGLIKHGLWTVVIVTVNHLAGNIYPENFLLWFGHAGMALQAVLFWYYFGLPLSLFQAAAISGWYIFNDYLDYVVGIHPYVDPVVSIVMIRNMAVSFTAVLSALYLFTALRRKNSK